MNAFEFVEQLSSLSLRDTFNPYRDKCYEHDHDTSPDIRRANLIRYLEAYIEQDFDSIWLGRDCGYRGARRTGIALTDEYHLGLLAQHFQIFGISKATLGPTVRERTATEVWKIIGEIKCRVFLWNVFPFHPHESYNSMSNRRYTATEFAETRYLLECLLKWLKPTRIVTLGVDAHREISRLGFKAEAVRHPSYGGHIQFARELRRMYS